MKKIAIAAALTLGLTVPLWTAGSAAAEQRPRGYYVCSYYYPFTCPDGVQGYGSYPPPYGLVYGEAGPDYDLCYPGFYRHDRLGWRRAHFRPSCNEPRAHRS
jgi:hypothetical protein